MYLGLDLGTSGLRGLLVDASGAAIGDASQDYAVSNPHDGWSEQDPALWVDACRAVLASLRADYPEAFGAIRGIGVAGHMHGATMLDESGESVRPCILWNDTRSAKQAAALDAQTVFRDLSGNIVFPGFTAPKLQWVATHEPEAFARIATVMLPKDYLVWWFTGRLVSEMSDAAGTSWLDVGARDWSDVLIRQSGMRRDQMPDLVEGSDPAGSVTDARAAELGLPPGVVVAGGGGDNAAAACGVGALSEGQGFVSLGTSGVLLAARDSYAPEPDSAVHTFCHAVPGKWYQMGVTLSATDSLNWLADLVGKPPAALAGQLESAPEAPSRILFLPYLSGERTPHNDAAIRGAFIGLSKTHDDTDMVQAVMEGVAFSLLECLEALRGTGAHVTRLLAIGGGSNSDVWVQMLADIFDLTIDVPEKGDFGAALGAARLAIVASGDGAPETVMTPPSIARSVSPRPELRAAYDGAYERYSKLYPRLKDLA